MEVLRPRPLHAKRILVSSSGDHRCEPRETLPLVAGASERLLAWPRDFICRSCGEPVEWPVAL